MVREEWEGKRRGLVKVRGEGERQWKGSADGERGRGRRETGQLMVRKEGEGRGRGQLNVKGEGEGDRRGQLR